MNFGFLDLRIFIHKIQNIFTFVTVSFFISTFIFIVFIFILITKFIHGLFIILIRIRNIVFLNKLNRDSRWKFERRFLLRYFTNSFARIRPGILRWTFAFRTRKNFFVVESSSWWYFLYLLLVVDFRLDSTINHILCQSFQNDFW